MQLFFDLDGTLTDSAPGIVRSVNHALESLSGRTQPDADIRAMIGLPLSVIFETLFMSRDLELIDRAVVLYRERFNDTGIYENALFPGVTDTLEALRGHDCAMRIVTSKPVVAARRVLEHFDILRFFDAVHGPSLSDRTSDKRVLLAEAIGPLAGPRSRMAMVGDRVEDVHAGRVCGLRTVAAAWGYGARRDLEDAGPDHIAESFPDLTTWLLAGRSPAR